MINPLDGRNPKKPKIQTADFFVNIGILVKLYKKAKIIISFFMKNSQNNNIILGFSFSFMYLVSVDAKD